MSNHNSGLQRSRKHPFISTLIPLYRCVTEKEKKNWKICKYSKECLKAFIYLFKCEIEKNVKVLVG